MLLLRLAVMTPALMLAACGSRDDTVPGGIDFREAQELNDAAAMLGNDAIDLNAVAGAGR